MDKHNGESGCYDNKLSETRCKICDCRIEYKLLDLCKQKDGSYICPACLHDIEANKHREEMGQD